jgi:hypothetical protein
LLNIHRSNFQAHPFHLVSPSPWPLYTSISLLTLTTSGVLSFHGFNNSEYFLTLAFFTLVLSMSFWFRDIISEGTYIGNHTLAVQRGLNMGVALFIVSEALFFVAIFWTFFHSALSPTVELGAMWPPMGIEAINPFELPLLNTVILLSSGVCLIWKRFYKFGFFMILLVLLFNFSNFYTFTKNFYSMDMLFLILIINFMLFYLNDWKLSKNVMLKYVQIIFFLVIFLLCFLFVYENAISTNTILSVGDMNNEIGTKINNNLNLQGHVHVNDKEAGKTIATQVGITGAMIGGALGVGKAIAKSPMPPLQKASAVVGASVAVGVSQAVISAISTVYTSKPSRTATSSIVSNNIDKFINDSQSSPIQDIFFSLEIMDYVCLSMVYMLIIQLFYKLYLKDNINLNLFKILGNNINNKIEFYLNKIIKLNKQMSVIWIWFIIIVLLFGITLSLYGINTVSADTGRFISFHSSVNNNIMPTIYESIEVALFNLKVVNYISLFAVTNLTILLLFRFHFNKKINISYIWFLLIILIVALGFSAYTFNELYTNLDSYVNIYNMDNNDLNELTSKK